MGIVYQRKRNVSAKRLRALHPSWNENQRHEYIEARKTNDGQTLFEEFLARQLKKYSNLRPLDAFRRAGQDWQRSTFFKFKQAEAARTLKELPGIDQEDAETIALYRWKQLSPALDRMRPASIADAWFKWLHE